MATQDAPAGPVKVFLWSIGRTASTAVLKCLTYVPDTVAWQEPYLQLSRFSSQVGETGDVTRVERSQKLVEEHGGPSAVAEIKSGYDASDKDYDWLKEQLEGDFPGKKVVIVKDMAPHIERDGLHDKIPKGFRHTFLIRNPEKLKMSALRLASKRLQSGGQPAPGLTPNHAGVYQLASKLWKYVKEENLESHPVIIDSDELLENPKEILKAYCKEVGIPFTEDLLTWEAGDDVMTKHWMVPKQTILTFRALGFHDSTFKTTGFQKPSSSPSKDDSANLLLNILPPEAKEAIDARVRSEMKIYEEMYAQRLTVNKK